MTTTLAPDHVPSELDESERDQALLDGFTTALEGGIGYWSVCSRYRWYVGPDADLDKQAKDFIAVIIETEDDDEPTYVIDRTVIARGIRKAHEHGGWNDYHARGIRNLQFGKYDEADYDSDTADIIVQFGLFGEQRYA
jgi:hypothetical protein